MSVIKVTVKWGKEKFDNVQLNLAEPPSAFKAALFSLTGVPPDRQKIMGLKGGLLKDDTPWANTGVKEGAQLMLVGTAAELKAPEQATVFVEDLPEAAQDSAALGMPAGLTNLGNTCYLNASLQVLRAVPELRQLVSTYGQAGAPAAAPAAAGDHSHQVTNALRGLFRDLQSQHAAVGPLAFVTLFRTAFPQFAQKDTKSNAYAQQDADEAWAAVMSTLQARIQPANALPALFGGETLSTYTCTEAPTEPPTHKKETFFKLSCNITNETAHLLAGLRDGLKEQLTKRSETLGRDAVYQRVSQLTRLPAYLTVQFVRFFWRADVKGKAKILRPVEFPMVLDTFELCADDLKARLKERRDALHAEEEAKKKAAPAPAPAVSKQPALPQSSLLTEAGRPLEQCMNTTGRYELCGIVSHKGRSADGGHYVGWVRDAPDRWIKFDDDSVSVVNDEEVKKLSGKGGGDWHIAYLCLYRSKPDL